MAMKGGNPQNLNPVRSKEEATERGRNGGIASGKARRKKRTMKSAAKMILDMAVSSPKVTEQLIAKGFDEEDITNQVAILVAMANKAAKGDVKAATFLRDTVGESPAERMHKTDSKLRRDEFDYMQEKDAGVASEIEDLDGLEADIYGADTESGQEKSEEETDDSL